MPHITRKYYQNKLARQGGGLVNIGIMQFSNLALNTKSIATSRSAVTSGQSTPQANRFEDIFNKAIATPSKNEVSMTEETSEPIDFEKIENLLNSQSIEEVVDLLEIPHDDDLLMLGAGEDGQAIAFDELMNLDNLISVLNIEPQQLIETIQQLSGAEMEPANDLWQLISSVVGQESQVGQQLMAALQGEQKVTPKQAEQLLQFLKLAQVAGKNADLMQTQVKVLEQVNDLVTSIIKDVNANLQKVETTSTSKVSLQGFEQLVQKIVKRAETTDSSDTKTVQSTVTQLPTNGIKTITITLPAEKGAQSEALAKEMQNLLNRSQISTAPGMTKLLLKLYPENLGSIRIEVMQQDGVLTARLLTSTAQGKELLDSQLQQLKTAFANANIQMDRIDIAQSLQETDRNLKDQGQFGQQFKQQAEKEETEQDELEEDSEYVSFSDFLINEEV